MPTGLRPSKHVVAAGAVVTRPGQEVLLVHRPKYDDWSFPKGKADPGEQVAATAAREVAEETGLRIRLGMPLITQQYPIKVGTKEVRYWSARVVGDDDVSGYTYEDEIDEVAWVSHDKADRQLTYAYDRATLRESLAQPRRTHALVILRHALATTRKDWKVIGSGADSLRGLTLRGLVEAEALAPMLHAWAPDRLACSTSTRCRQTVAPWRDLARRLGDPVEDEFTEVLSEEGVSTAGVRELLDHARAFDGTTLICTHRPVLRSLLTLLGVPDRALEPGAALVVHHRNGKLLASEWVPAPFVG